MLSYGTCTWTRTPRASTAGVYLQHGPGMLRMAGCVPHVPCHPAASHHLLGDGHKPAGQRQWREQGRQYEPIRWPVWSGATCQESRPCRTAARETAKPKEQNFCQRGWQLHVDQIVMLSMCASRLLQNCKVPIPHPLCHRSTGTAMSRTSSTSSFLCCSMSGLLVQDRLNQEGSITGHTRTHPDNRQANAHTCSTPHRHRAA